MKKALISLIALTLVTTAGAELRLPAIISDNAVIQQQTEISLWGWDDPGAVVTAIPSWQTETASATTDASGRWNIRMKTPAASMTPLEITFLDDKGSSRKISNILSGEVWLASGQSNMEMPLRGFWTQPVEGAAHAIAYSGKNPQIRFATIPKAGSYEPQEDVVTEWKVSNPKNAADFSALAYHFATSLSDIIDTPIGIISCAYGGSKVEGWLPAWKLAEYPDCDIEKDKNDPEVRDYHKMNVMWNAMFLPVKDYTVKGILWNQGESNVGRHEDYPQRLADMVEIWREANGNRNMPFYQVEIPGWHYDDPDATDAALFRECQNRSVSLIPNSDIVSTSDLVYPYELEDIHASRKKEIGERLAFKAAALTYGIDGVPHEFPRFLKAEIDGNKAVLSFTGADAGFTPNDVLEGFEVAGADRVFHPADATEDWNTRQIIVTSDKVKDIKSVRYCFHNFAIGKVKNLMGLPLVPFRTDDWEK